MRAWLRLRRRAAPVRRHFADLQAMTPGQRQAVLAGADGIGWVEASAVYGLVEAQVLLGQSLLERDPARAIGWFRAAAGAGYPPALNMLGRCCEKGWGTSVDLAEAARCYRMAAESGQNWGQFNLANLLLYGIGVPRDRLAAFAWYERAAGQGHAKAMNMIGRFHEEGWDRPCSPIEALDWYRRSAESGDYRGQYNFGTVLMQQGRGAEALAWFERALAAGDADFVAEACQALALSSDPAHRALAKPPASGSQR